MSVIGAGTRLTGRVSGQGALRIEGTVKGEVQVSGEAEIAENASVEGNLQAETLDVGGTLIGDATAKGPIAVRAGALVRGELRASEVSIEPGDSPESVRVAIRDHGSGIDPAMAEKLFVPFASGRAGGAGLGLALARRIVLLHRGRLELANAEGGGARAIVEVPADVFVT